MSPRRSAAEAAETRAAILHRAVDVASVEGLEGLTIGRLAGDVGMSKAGVVGGFGSKESLQLATFEAAVERFTREVWSPIAGETPGLPRLHALAAAWIAYLEGDVFPGGCFLTAAATEFDGRPGPVRDAVRAALGRWLKVLEREVGTAVEAGDLPAGTDPQQVAFELNALAAGTNQAIQLQGDADAGARGLAAMRRTVAASAS